LRIPRLGRSQKATEEGAVKHSFIVPCLSASLLLLAAGEVRAQTAAARPQTYAGLEVTLAGVENAPNAGLSDCPQGANIVRGMTKPGEQFTIVTLNFKVLPTFKPVMLKRPVLEDADGKTYNTAVSFVDVASKPEFSCTFPFRTKEGTKVKSLRLDTVTFDLTKAPVKTSSH
jgi:hypothetical protein